MSVEACLLFLACAFYLGYFAETLNAKASTVIWSISLALAIIPICELLYEHIRWWFR